MSQNTIQYGTIEVRDQDIWNQQQKTQKNQNIGEMELEEGVMELADNVLKGIRNPIPRKPDNPIKEIWDLVLNGIWRQWPRGLTVPTQIDINLSTQTLIASWIRHLY